MNTVLKIKRVRIKEPEGIKEYAISVDAKNILLNNKNLETEMNKIDNKVDKIAGKDLSDANFTQTEKDKLKILANNANNYNLPIASNTQLGGIKIGTGFTQLEDGTINVINKIYDDTNLEKALKEKANEVKAFQIVAFKQNWILANDVYVQEVEVPYLFSDGIGIADTLDKNIINIKEYEKIVDMQTSLNKITLTAEEKPTLDLQIIIYIIDSNESPIYIGIYPLIKEIELTEENPDKTIAIETNQKDFTINVDDDLFNIVNNNNNSITISKTEKYAKRKIRINFNAANGYNHYNDIIVKYLPHAKGTELDKSLIKSNIYPLAGGTIYFTNKLSPTGTDYSKARDGSIRCIIEGQDATISGDGGVLAPNDCSYMFSNNNAQSYHLDLSSFDTSKVTNMRQMFWGCRASSIYLSSFDTSKVTDMSGMFWASRAYSLDLSSFDTSNVTNMEAMFYYCYTTATLDLSSFDTSNVTDMNHMFYYCYSNTLDLSSFDTSKVTNMDNMFYYAKATKIYCRTEKDKQRFLASSNCTPTADKFIVKH